MGFCGLSKICVALEKLCFVVLNNLLFYGFGKRKCDFMDSKRNNVILLHLDETILLWF